MSLSTIIQEINKVRPASLEDVDSGPRETIQGRRGRKKAAVEKMKSLREQYVEELMRSAVFIVVTGSAKDDFVKTATEEYHCFSADPETFYRDLTGRVAPAMYQGKESVANLFDILGRHLEDKANEMNIVGYPQLIFKQTYRRMITNREDLMALVKQAINEQVGSEIVGIQAVRSIVDTAIEKNHASKNTPILLSTSDLGLVHSLMTDLERLNPKVFLVSAGKSPKMISSVEGVVRVKDVNSGTVEEALTSINKSIKK